MNLQIFQEDEAFVHSALPTHEQDDDAAAWAEFETTRSQATTSPELGNE
jgi:hypothetical protein